jgi:hypothetical protein
LACFTKAIKKRNKEREKRGREVRQQSKFSPFSWYMKLQNCLQTVTVIWWQFCNLRAANCICVQQCVLNEIQLLWLTGWGRGSAALPVAF